MQLHQHIESSNACLLNGSIYHYIYFDRYRSE